MRGWGDQRAKRDSEKVSDGMLASVHRLGRCGQTAAVPKFSEMQQLRAWLPLLCRLLCCGSVLLLQTFTDCTPLTRLGDLFEHATADEAGCAANLIPATKAVMVATTVLEGINNRGYGNMRQKLWWHIITSVVVAREQLR